MSRIQVQVWGGFFLLRREVLLVSLARLLGPGMRSSNMQFYAKDQPRHFTGLAESVE